MMGPYPFPWDVVLFGLAMFIALTWVMVLAIEKLDLARRLNDDEAIRSFESMAHWGSVLAIIDMMCVVIVVVKWATLNW